MDRTPRRARQSARNKTLCVWRWWISSGIPFLVAHEKRHSDWNVVRRWTIARLARSWECWRPLYSRSAPGANWHGLRREGGKSGKLEGRRVMTGLRAIVSAYAVWLSAASHFPTQCWPACLERNEGACPERNEGSTPVGGHRLVAVAHLAVRLVPQLRKSPSIGIRCQGRRAEACPERSEGSPVTT
jgi:hypothetical protein